MAAILQNLPEQLCRDPRYNGRNMTNRVLMQQRKMLPYDKSQKINQKKKITFYCPAYTRIKIKNFSQLNHQDLHAAVNMNICLTVNLRGIPALIENKIKKLLRLSFNRDASLKVEQEASTKKPQGNGVYTYIIPKCINVAIMPQIFYSPFQLLYLILSLQIQDIQINQEIINQIIDEGQFMIKKLNIQLDDTQKKNKQMKKLNIQLNDTQKQNQQMKQIISEQIQELEQEIKQLKLIDTLNVRFNMMDCMSSQIKIQFTAEGTFGNYNLAQALLSAQYTNQSTCKRIRDKKLKKSSEIEGSQSKKDYSIVKPFKYAHFEIPLYKFPLVTITTIFIPFWFISVITIGIYFQQPELSSRVQSISTLLIAFVQLISVIRQQLPLSPKLSLIEYFVYIELVCTCILILIHSIKIKVQRIDEEFVWYQNGWFYVSVAVSIVQFLIIIVLLFIHHYYWQPHYFQRTYQGLQQKFNFEKWELLQCDKHFIRKIDKGRIKITPINEKVEEIKKFLPTINDRQIEVMKEEEQRKLQ